MQLLNTIATPYAEALLQIGTQQGCADALAADAGAVLNVWEANDNLREAMTSPVLEPHVKKSVLVAVFNDSLQPATLNVLKLLADRQRTSLVGAVFDRFLGLYRSMQGIAQAHVTSAVALSDAQQEALVERLRAMAGCAAIECSTDVDQSLIGGLVVRIGSRVVDASVAGQVRRLGISLARAV